MAETSTRDDLTRAVSSIVTGEVEQFRKMAADWWDPKCASGMLHKLNPVRLKYIRDQIDQRGTLDVLRHGIELLGLKEKLLLSQFKPALAINADILARYDSNRLRVVRQVRY